MTVSAVMTDKPIEVVEIEGRVPVNVKRVEKFYRALIDDKLHSPTCRCPSCLYQLHKKKGGRYKKESFFLDWLETEIRFSLVHTVEKTIYDSAYHRGDKARSFINGRDFFRARRESMRALSDFIKFHIPEIDSNHRRIKLKLWRFRKSGVLQELEKEISAREFETSPLNWKESSRGFRLAQRIADFIYRQKGRRAEQREIRRFIQIPIEEIEALRPWLLSNYGIECRPGSRKNQVVYFGTAKNSRGSFMRFGMTS